MNNNVSKDTQIHGTHLIPSFEHALTSAPYLAKTLTTSTCPLEQASWSGVHPALSFAFGSIPWWMWCRTVSYEKHTLPSNYKFIIIIYLHSAVAPSKCLTQIFKSSLRGLRIASGWRQTSWLFTSVAKDLNSGKPWTNPARGQNVSWSQGLRIASPVL